ncbi:uncharacterized protein LOC126705855 isoform X2 [Quercus robur]|uniref:uncharacterized protein LOC126705855 isoform X2 n=1 Tax=Quercus robur TaxID=38942 RepID=UPI0021630B0A|nr:uncharacterized protein LOC126705855 isoform X2 [Quercus robur]
MLLPTTNMSSLTIASSHQSFPTNTLSNPPNHYKPSTKILYSAKTISCRHPSHDDEQDSDSPRKNENPLAKLAIVTLAAGVLTLGSVHDASAAKTGGRVGGQAFRSAAPRPPPRINNNSSCPTFSRWVRVWLWRTILWWLGLVTIFVLCTWSKCRRWHWRWI